MNNSDQFKRTLLVDTEGGSLSVRHLIRNHWKKENGLRTATVYNPEGLVDVEEAPLLADVDAALWRLRSEPGSPKGYPDRYDVVVLDTITALAMQHRHTVIFERTGIRENAIISNLLKLGSEQRDWGTATDNMMMVLRQYRSLPCVTIFTAHESIKEDETTKETKIGPAVNKQLLGDLLNFTDDAFRLSAVMKPTTYEDKIYPARTRFLRMAQSDQHFTKIRIGVGMHHPELLPDPDLWKVRTVLGPFFANRFLIFGSAGAGKTSFACSLSTASIPDSKTTERKQQSTSTLKTGT